MTGRACQSVRPTWPCFVALDRYRFLRPDTSPPWNSPPASLRSSSTNTGPDFGLTEPACGGAAHQTERAPNPRARACCPRGCRADITDRAESRPARRAVANDRPGRARSPVLLQSVLAESPPVSPLSWKHDRVGHCRILAERRQSCPRRTTSLRFAARGSDISLPCSRRSTFQRFDVSEQPANCQRSTGEDGIEKRTSDKAFKGCADRCRQGSQRRVP